ALVAMRGEVVEHDTVLLAAAPARPREGLSVGRPVEDVEPEAAAVKGGQLLEARRSRRGSGMNEERVQAVRRREDRTVRRKRRPPDASLGVARHLLEAASIGADRPGLVRAAAVGHEEDP